VYQQQRQEQEEQDAENPFLDPPFSQIKSGKPSFFTSDKTFVFSTKKPVKKNTFSPAR
jgi:hypothetical protein